MNLMKTPNCVASLLPKSDRFFLLLSYDHASRNLYKRSFNRSRSRNLHTLQVAIRILPHLRKRSVIGEVNDLSLNRCGVIVEIGTRYRLGTETVVFRNDIGELGRSDGSEDC